MRNMIITDWGSEMSRIDISTLSVYGTSPFDFNTHAMRRVTALFHKRVVNSVDMNIEKMLIGSAKDKRFPTHGERAAEMHQHTTIRSNFAIQLQRRACAEKFEQCADSFCGDETTSSSGKMYRFYGAMACNIISQLAVLYSDFRYGDGIMYGNINLEEACSVGFSQVQRRDILHTH
ncbi:hypothetical protein J1614_005063 [Plenodomus biglobosus]|nr:hypothetical protein J1614_005063 [Plenodomus biglobosus]